MLHQISKLFLIEHRINRCSDWFGLFRFGILGLPKPKVNGTETKSTKTAPNKTEIKPNRKEPELNRKPKYLNFAKIKVGLVLNRKFRFCSVWIDFGRFFKNRNLTDNSVWFC